MAWQPNGLVFSSVWIGEPDTVKAALNRAIGAFGGHGAFHQKVGITNNPDIRWCKHRANGWREMRVLYQSPYREDVIYLECKLVRRFHMGVVHSAGYYHNEVGGGGGRLPKEGPHYVYLLMNPKGQPPKAEEREMDE